MNNKGLLTEQPLQFPFWIISDTHFGHRNIIKYCGRPQDHERLMRDHWRETIAPRDVVLHLGDFALDSAYNIERRAKSLPGKKFLLKGNHDRHSKGFYEKAGFTFLKHGFVMPYKDWTVVFTHHPDCQGQYLGAPKRLNVHGHIHEKVLGDRRYINVSVEQLDYRPVQIVDLLEQRISELSA